MQINWVLRMVLGRQKKATTVEKLAVRERCENKLGPEIGPGKTEKAAIMNKLEVREREYDELVSVTSPGRTEKAPTGDKLAVREREDKLGPDNGPGKTMMTDWTNWL